MMLSSTSRHCCRAIALYCLLAALLPVLAHAQSVSDFPATINTGTMEPPSGITMKNYPRVDGSTSTMFLGRLMAARILDVPAEICRVDMSQRPADPDEGVPYMRGNDALPARLVFPLHFPVSRVREFMDFVKGKAIHTGTDKAYMNLIGGDADLILVAREPSPDEAEAARKAGVALDLRPVALDAFVFVVNVKNSVDSLSLEQVRGIFGGTIKNWKEVGGKDEPIISLIRERNSGSEELMKSLVMKGREIVPSTQRPEKIMTMGALIRDVATISNAIGYTLYFYEQAIYPNPDKKALAIDGVPALPITIATGRYPLVAPVYAVTRKDLKEDTPTAKLRDWLLTHQGQQTVAASGLIPMNR